MAERIDLLFGLSTLVGQRKHSSVVFARWRQCAHAEGYIRWFAPPGDHDWTVCLRRRCSLMSNYFDHLFSFRKKLDSTLVHCACNTDLHSPNAVAFEWKWDFRVSSFCHVGK